LRAKVIASLSERNRCTMHPHCNPARQTGPNLEPREGFAPAGLEQPGGAAGRSLPHGRYCLIVPPGQSVARERVVSKPAPRAHPQRRRRTAEASRADLETGYRCGLLSADGDAEGP
jgi:hypothetical protein